MIPCSHQCYVIRCALRRLQLSRAPEGCSCHAVLHSAASDNSPVNNFNCEQQKQLYGMPVIHDTCVWHNSMRDST